MTEEKTPEEQILPPDYTAPIGPEDDRGFVEFNPEPENGIDLRRAERKETDEET